MSEPLTVEEAREKAKAAQEHYDELERRLASGEEPIPTPDEFAKAKELARYGAMRVQGAQKAAERAAETDRAERADKIIQRMSEQMPEAGAKAWAAYEALQQAAAEFTTAADEYVSAGKAFKSERVMLSREVGELPEGAQEPAYLRKLEQAIKLHCPPVLPAIYAGRAIAFAVSHRADEAHRLLSFRDLYADQFAYFRKRYAPKPDEARPSAPKPAKRTRRKASS